MRAISTGRLGLPTAGLLALLALVWTASPSAAQAVSKQQELVEKASLTLAAIRRQPQVGEPLDAAIEKSYGVMIIPALVKGSFIFGAEGGSGVLLARRDDGTWSSPVFVTLAAASFGLQIGGTVSEVVFTIMTDRGVDAVLRNKVKLGADLAIAAGPIGGNIEASTTTAAGADIFSYALSQGLFAGGAFEGAVIETRDSWNQLYYGSAVDSQAIVSDPAVNNPGADALRASISPL